ncbi:MAG: hypothetical protein IKW32_05985, partial [Bacteroidaceae bacterium]|nr:hypothetical protein [Bacteroidaceae bacterium]
MFDNQPLKDKTAKKYKKYGINIWSICYKAVILHPLSREKRGDHEILKQRTGFDLYRFEKKLFSKKTSKSFG